MMKRIKREGENNDNNNNDITVMANCLMLLSGQDSISNHRVFTCKTCDRQFPSFQALGGHRASHKKPRIMVMMSGGGGVGDDDDHVIVQTHAPSSPPKQKTHECSICGLEFPLGQALGGHMRRHRAINNVRDQYPTHPTFLSLSPSRLVTKRNLPKKRRILYLDLNLTPLENKFVFGKLVPTVDFI
ncbi:hypothetical protein OROMI_013746 [Orobanche minor]